MKKKSHQNWSWILMVLFLALSVVDYRFGLLGILCITIPLIHALRGHGKVHCSHYCPRGSLLGKFLKYVSLEKNLPSVAREKWFKNGLIILMLVVFTISLIHSAGDWTKIGFAIFRLMSASLAVGILTGIIFKPRSWCVVCPMGHGTELIKTRLDRSKK